MNDPMKRALLSTGFFASAGILSFFFFAPSNLVLWPNTLFYAVIVLNTFFSVRFFARITPHSWTQSVVDGVLVLIYLALALSLGREWAFPFFALCIFVAAPIKYVLMLGKIPHSDLLRRKLLIELLGAGLCTAALLCAVFLGYPLTAAWTLAIIFSLANIYLLAIRPMYRL